MRRLECTKCRRVQPHCTCDHQTLDFVDILRDQYRYAPDEYFERKPVSKPETDYGRKNGRR